MSTPLFELLRECRCHVEPDDLKRSIVAVFAKFCRGMTIEEILCDPCGKAIPFANRVREYLGDYSVPDNIILQVALNLRKQAKLPLLTRTDSLSQSGR